MTAYLIGLKSAITNHLKSERNLVGSTHLNKYASNVCWNHHLEITDSMSALRVDSYSPPNNPRGALHPQNFSSKWPGTVAANSRPLWRLVSAVNKTNNQKSPLSGFTWPDVFVDSFCCMLSSLDLSLAHFGVDCHQLYHLKWKPWKSKCHGKKIKKRIDLLSKTMFFK